MVHADYLFLMTDVDCLYTDNPRKNPEAKAVRVVKDIAEVRKTGAYACRASQSPRLEVSTSVLTFVGRRAYRRRRQSARRRSAPRWARAGWRPRSSRPSWPPAPA